MSDAGSMREVDSAEVEVLESVRLLRIQAEKVCGQADGVGGLRREVRKLDEAVKEIKRKLGMTDSAPVPYIPIPSYPRWPYRDVPYRNPWVFPHATWCGSTGTTEGTVKMGYPATESGQ